MAKKKKSIYDYELKDNSGDGKVNFGDTWLGDALGFDGKLGVQKQGMKASMKGARRKMGGGKSDEAPKKPGKTSTSTSGTTHPRSSPKRDPYNTSGKSSGPGASGKDPYNTSGKSRGPGKSTSKGPQVDTTSPQQPSTTKAKENIKKANTGQSSRPSTNRPAGKPKAPASESAPSVDKTKPAPIDRGVTYEQWEKMSRKERKAKGLPQTITGWQNQRWLGYNKGGMVKKEGRYQQNGKRDYKGSGMFYKSGSPRGYK